MSGILYHGGVPGLHKGDIIEPGHSRDRFDDCPICRARRTHGPDAPEGTGHPEQVYCTSSRDYAAFYASMYGRGDVYQIENPLPRNPTPQMLAHWQTRLLQQAERIMTIKETE